MDEKRHGGQRRMEDVCPLHGEKDCQMDKICKKLEQLEVIEQKSVKWGIFTWIISGVSTIVLVIMSLAYSNLKETIKVSIEHWHEKDETQDFEIREMRKKFDAIDTKLDRNLDQINALHGIKTINRK